MQVLLPHTRHHILSVYQVVGHLDNCSMRQCTIGPSQKCDQYTQYYKLESQHCLGCSRCPVHDSHTYMHSSRPQYEFCLVSFDVYGVRQVMLLSGLVQFTAMNAIADTLQGLPCTLLLYYPTKLHDLRCVVFAFLSIYTGCTTLLAQRTRYSRKALNMVFKTRLIWALILIAAIGSLYLLFQPSNGADFWYTTSLCYLHNMYQVV